eukprot:ANDGO_08070.mRNA.1 hypothetical protein
MSGYLSLAGTVSAMALVTVVSAAFSRFRSTLVMKYADMDRHVRLLISISNTLHSARANHGKVPEDLLKIIADGVPDGCEIETCTRKVSDDLLMVQVCGKDARKLDDSSVVCTVFVPAA